MNEDELNDAIDDEVENLIEHVQGANLKSMAHPEGAGEKEPDEDEDDLGEMGEEE